MTPTEAACESRPCRPCHRAVPDGGARWTPHVRAVRSGRSIRHGEVLGQPGMERLRSHDAHAQRCAPLHLALCCLRTRGSLIRAAPRLRRRLVHSPRPFELTAVRTDAWARQCDTRPSRQACTTRAACRPRTATSSAGASTATDSQGPFPTVRAAGSHTPRFGLVLFVSDGVVPMLKDFEATAK